MAFNDDFRRKLDELRLATEELDNLCDMPFVSDKNQRIIQACIDAQVVLRDIVDQSRAWSAGTEAEQYESWRACYVDDLSNALLAVTNEQEALTVWQCVKEANRVVPDAFAGNEGLMAYRTIYSILRKMTGERLLQPFNNGYRRTERGTIQHRINIGEMNENELPNADHYFFLNRR